MCEPFIARAAEPFPLEALWPRAERTERYGIADLGGVANLAVLDRDGGAHHYAGNPENPVFAFRLGRIGLATTGLYSIDRSLFRLAATGATNRRLVRLTGTVSLDGHGIPTDPSPARPARRPGARM